MPGFASGFHEGSRSEYLAQYVFSGFGTASAIPHQEDHGFDLYCTLAQGKGPVRWADKPFTVQVKSGRERWIFKNQKSVEWFINHPLPLFLCVVDKRKARFSVFQSTPKYYFWAISQPYPERLEMSTEWRGSEGRCFHWQPGNVPSSLSLPILDFTLDRLADKGFFTRAKAVLDSWLDLEYENLFRIASHVRQWVAPRTYKTNEPLPENLSGTVYQSGNTTGEKEFQETLSRLRHTLAWVMEQARRQGDWRGGMRAALLLRHFLPNEGSPYGSPSHVGWFSSEMHHELGITNPPYVYAIVDQIAALIDAKIPAKKEKRS